MNLSLVPSFNSQRVRAIMKKKFFCVAAVALLSAAVISAVHGQYTIKQ